jgi:hypothetical protein
VTAFAEVIDIDISTIPTDVALLERLGEVFEFGGPDGNVRYRTGMGSKGWGINWNALHDSLSYLDTGGIWGTSRIPKFPLCVRFLGCESYKARNPEGFSILEDILLGKETAYDLQGLVFRCEFR